LKFKFSIYRVFALTNVLYVYFELSGSGLDITFTKKNGINVYVKGCCLKYDRLKNY